MSRRNPFGDTENALPENLIPTGRKTSKRKSDWNKKNAPTAYAVPGPLAEKAQAVREQIRSMSKIDENGKPRTSPLTADVVANVVISWAIARVQKTPSLMPASVTPSTRTGITAYAAAWEGYRKPPVYPKNPVRKSKKQPAKKHILSYRIAESSNQEIRKIAEQTGVAVGEVFLRLMEIGIADHNNCDYRVAPTPEVVYASATHERLKPE